MFQNQFDKSDVINSIKEISDKIIEENDKENTNEDVVTTLMFEQMLRGLYLQNFPMD